jgi:hypothetical protein
VDIRNEHALALGEVASRYAPPFAVHDLALARVLQHARAGSVERVGARHRADDAGVDIRNYLVPRDCPRVMYYADARTVPEDRARFLGTSAAVVAVEASWWNRIRSCTLYRYHLPPETFECIDECAGYFVSRESVRPLQVESISDPVAALLARGVELRILPTLGPLRDSVVASTLQFSIIRMRNANASTQRDR